ncbi:MAG: GAF domain-containing protein [Nitrococcus sp.]|nr:GAF domain-containing protein [Nitrococcus sp.]
MLQQPLNILHLEGNSNDAQAVQEALTKAGLDCRMKVVATGDDYLPALREGEIDLILAEDGIPGLDGLSLLEIARRQYPGIPFIFVSRLADERSLRPIAGASSAGCVSKHALQQLVPTIKRALQLPASTTCACSLTPSGHTAERLVAIVQQLALARELSAVRDIACQAARALTGADGAAFFQRDGELGYCAEENAIGPLWKGQHFPMTRSLSGWTMLNRQATVIEDVYSDARIAIDAYRPTFVKSLVMVPIRTAAPIGAIGIYRATRHQASPEEVRLLQALADSASLAMQHIQLSNRFRALSQRLFETAENERRHIAHELYDEIGQLLIAIQFNLQSNKVHSEALPLQPPLDTSIGIAERLCQRVQKLALNLYPELLDNLGLVCALKWHLRQATQHTGLLARFHSELDSRFGQNIEIICFRVAEEAINNVISHAMAGSIRVEIGEQDNHLCLAVVDDGIGFDVSKLRFDPHHRSLGLLGMQERALLIGGDVRITSVPGEGTTVRGRFPLKTTAIDDGAHIQ